jgi:hypothetical protein
LVEPSRVLNTDCSTACETFTREVSLRSEQVIFHTKADSNWTVVVVVGALELVGDELEVLLGDVDGDLVAVVGELELVGDELGVLLGDVDGEMLGPAVGLALGLLDGDCEGLAVGDTEGLADGDFVSVVGKLELVGDELGVLLGDADGEIGAAVGTLVGRLVVTVYPDVTFGLMVT